MLFKISSGQILKVSLFTSEKIGIPPTIEIASALEANVNDGTINYAKDEPSDS